MKFKANEGAIKQIDLKEVSNDALKVISDSLLKEVRGGNFTRTFDRVSST